MGKNLAGRLNRLLSIAGQAAERLDNAAVAAAEARLAPVDARSREHLIEWIRAKHEGRPAPEYAHEPYQGEAEDRELVHQYRAQFYPPGYDAGAELRRRLD